MNIQNFYRYVYRRYYYPIDKQIDNKHVIKTNILYLRSDITQIGEDSSVVSWCSKGEETEISLSFMLYEYKFLWPSWAKVKYIRPPSNQCAR